MRAVKPIQPIDKETREHAALLKIIAMAHAEIKRGKFQPLEQALDEIDKSIKEKYP